MLLVGSSFAFSCFRRFSPTCTSAPLQLLLFGNSLVLAFDINEIREWNRNANYSRQINYALVLFRC